MMTINVPDGKKIGDVLTDGSGRKVELATLQHVLILIIPIVLALIGGAIHVYIQSLNQDTLNAQMEKRMEVLETQAVSDKVWEARSEENQKIIVEMLNKISDKIFK